MLNPISTTFDTDSSATSASVSATSALKISSARIQRGERRDEFHFKLMHYPRISVIVIR